MSRANVDVVRRSYEVVNALGETGPEFVDPEEVAPEFWARLAPEFELHDRPDLPDARVYRGRDATKEFWRKLQELFVEVRWEPREFVDLGHAVVVDARVVVRGRGSDVPTEADETAVFWFEDGLMTRLQAFATREEALEAARAPV